MPMRAQISWIPDISGYENNIIQRSEKPNRLPACEYVAMPLGSSSDAPVMSPGPNLARSPARAFPDAVGFHAVVVVVELGGAASSGFELIALAFGVHAVGVDVVLDGCSPFLG